MTTATERVCAALRTLPPKPADDGDQREKKSYSEKMSRVLAEAIAHELRERGMDGARPAPPGTLDRSGAERRMAGGIGAKKVDVTWATEESGLLLGISIKTINFRDNRTKNFQKNLTNRRDDTLYEAATLHKRFPYAVLAAFLWFPFEASEDGGDRRSSTFLNAHRKSVLFTGRSDPHGREEQYERFYIVLHRVTPMQASFDVYEAGKPDKALDLDCVLDEIVSLVVERNPDMYDQDDGKIKRA